MKINTIVSNVEVKKTCKRRKCTQKNQKKILSRNKHENYIKGKEVHTQNNTKHTKTMFLKDKQMRLKKD